MPSPAVFPHCAFLRFLLAAASLVLAGAAHADGWPDKPITLIVPSAAGGAADLTARLFGQFLGQHTGQTVIVEDRPGAGGIIGTHVAKQARADGYTFLLSTNSTHAANAFLYRHLPYDAQKDFVQVGMLGTFGSVGIVAPGSPYRTVPELVAYVHKHPGAVFFGYYSSSSQVPSELFKQRAKLDIGGVGYKNITQIITDLRGKQIGFAFVDYLTAMGQIDGKGLAPLAVTAAQRHPAWPDVPTMSAYYPGFVVAGWLGISAPAGTPAGIVARMNAATQAAVKDPLTAGKLRALGLTPEAMDSARFDAFVKEDTVRWQAWIKVSGISPQ